MGGKLTLSCTKGTLEQDRVNGFKITSVANTDDQFYVVFYKNEHVKLGSYEELH